MTNLKSVLQEKRTVVEESLKRFLPTPETYPEILCKSIQYSLFAGGKRLRPILTLSSCEAIGGSIEDALPFACAIEMIHTYSLIHDDLPSMDDDTYRRGKLTNHKVFGEAMAILSGDALLTHAFFIMTDSGNIKNIRPSCVIQIVNEISSWCGINGMIAGQVTDIQSQNKRINKDMLRYIHINKTAALIKASVRAGAIVGGASQKNLDSLTEYGEKIGLAFQITDDILDIEGKMEKLGKDVGSDRRHKKATYPEYIGLEESKKKAEKLMGEAMDAIKGFGSRADLLKELAGFVLQRDN